MVVDFVPVVVQRDDLPRPLKLKAPANMRMAQFIQRMRARLQLPRLQSCHLVCERGLPVAMSQSVGSVYRENGDRIGLLRFTCISESAFGCPLPPKPPVQKMFPGEEEGAAPEPAPSPLQSDDGSVSDGEPDEAPPALPSPAHLQLVHDLQAYFLDTQQPPSPGPAQVLQAYFAEHQGDIFHPPEGAEQLFQGIIEIHPPPDYYYYPSDEEEPPM